MQILKIFPSSPNERYIAEAAQAMDRGEVIIIPTDSLYAFACSALDQKAIDAIVRIKDLDPRRNTLSILCADLSQAAQYARIDNRAFRIMKDNSPGPCTFILPASTQLPRVFRNRREVGIRIPDSPIVEALIKALGHPIMSSSVPAAENDPMAAADPGEIAAEYASSPLVELMIDGGNTAGVPSAIVNLTDSSSPEIVREGPDEIIL